MRRLWDMAREWGMAMIFPVIMLLLIFLFVTFMNRGPVAEHVFEGGVRCYTYASNLACLVVRP